MNGAKNGVKVKSGAKNGVKAKSDAINVAIHYFISWVWIKNN